MFVVNAQIKKGKLCGNFSMKNRRMLNRIYFLREQIRLSPTCHKNQAIARVFGPCFLIFVNEGGAWCYRSFLEVGGVLQPYLLGICLNAEKNNFGTFFGVD